MKINKSKTIIKAIAVLLITAMLPLLAACKNEEKPLPKESSENKSPAADSKPVEDKPSIAAPVNTKVVVNLINEGGNTLEERFKVPEGFERIPVEKGSFAEYLRGQKLKPHGSKVLYYDGRVKDRQGVYEAVLDKSIGNRDLHQCADAIMLLRGEYLYNQKRYDEIKFHFVNGFLTEYRKWMQGYRITVSGNNASWVKSRDYSDSYEEFRRYMDIVFAYASTLSLEKELNSVKKEEMMIGDVFIKGADPGHAIIVMDMAVNKTTGEKLFLLAQSYMPAQETQILTNPGDKNLSPWYSLNYSGDLSTPEWTFSSNQLRRFVDEKK